MIDHNAGKFTFRILVANKKAKHKQRFCESGNLPYIIGKWKAVLCSTNYSEQYPIYMAKIFGFAQYIKSLEVRLDFSAVNVRTRNIKFICAVSLC